MTRFPEIGSEAFNDCEVGMTEGSMDLLIVGQGIKLDEIDFRRGISDDIDVKHSQCGLDKPEGVF